MANRREFVMPMAGTREAPVFKPDAMGFNTFFEDVQELAERAGLTEAKKIKWATRYASEHASAWEYVDCMKDPDHPPTFETFVKEVLLCYPHINATR